jgi:hypothetical protein
LHFYCFLRADCQRAAPFDDAKISIELPFRKRFIRAGATGLLPIQKLNRDIDHARLTRRPVVVAFRSDVASQRSHVFCSMENELFQGTNRLFQGTNGAAHSFLSRFAPDCLQYLRARLARLPLCLKSRDSFPVRKCKCLQLSGVGDCAPFFSFRAILLAARPVFVLSSDFSRWKMHFLADSHRLACNSTVLDLHAGLCI